MPEYMTPCDCCGDPDICVLMRPSDPDGAGGDTECSSVAPENTFPYRGRVRRGTVAWNGLGWDGTVLSDFESAPIASLSINLLGVLTATCGINVSIVVPAYFERYTTENFYAEYLDIPASNLAGFCCDASTSNYDIYIGGDRPGTGTHNVTGTGTEGIFTFRCPPNCCHGTVSISFCIYYGSHLNKAAYGTDEFPPAVVMNWVGNNTWYGTRDWDLSAGTGTVTTHEYEIVCCPIVSGVSICISSDELTTEGYHFRSRTGGGSWSNWEDADLVSVFPGCPTSVTFGASGFGTEFGCCNASAYFPKVLYASFSNGTHEFEILNGTTVPLTFVPLTQNWVSPEIETPPGTDLPGPGPPPTGCLITFVLRGSGDTTECIGDANPPPRLYAIVCDVDNPTNCETFGEVSPTSATFEPIVDLSFVGYSAGNQTRPSCFLHPFGVFSTVDIDITE